MATSSKELRADYDTRGVRSFFFKRRTAYELTPEGLKPTVEVPHGQSIRKLTGRRLDRAIIAVLAVALAYFVVDKFWISKHLSASQPISGVESQAQSAASRKDGAPAPATPPAFA